MIGRLSLVAVGLASLLAGCSSTPPSRAVPATSTTAAPAAPEAGYTVATAKGPSVAVYDGPFDIPASRSLPSPQPDGSTLVLLVEEQRPDWFKVLLPVRAAGATGWIRSSEVTVARHGYRIDVQVSAHKLTVWKGDAVFLEDTVAVGAPATPTALGRFYTTGIFETARTRPAYGPFAYPLSGWAEALFDVGGGDGQMGIHGTNDPSSLGRSVSSGCIRMSNDAITRLARSLPLGVPVEIRA